MEGAAFHIPRLTTERLVLRALRLDDFEPYAAMLASDRARYMEGRLDRKTAWYWFCQDVAHWPLYGFGTLAVVEQSTGTLVGEVGISKGMFPETELGWLLFEGHEGKGYATEAAAALRTWAFAEAGLTTLVSYVDSENRRSQAVATRLGAVVDPDAKKSDPADLVYRHAPEAA